MIRGRRDARLGRVVAAVAAAATLASACTSSRPPARPEAAEGTAKTTAPAVRDTTVVPDEAAPAEQGTPAGAKSTGRVSQPGAESRGSVVGAGAAGGQGLFAEGEDRVGIGPNTIRLCTHYRKYLGKVFDTDEEDVDVYWRSLNDRGGIFGRKVEERLVEDGGGRLVAQAYEECRGSFLIRGAPGAEAIGPMRRIIEADAHPAPYLHYTARSDPAARYSFSFYPSHELYGRLSAQYVARRFGGKRIGIIHKDSDNWEAGHQGFLAALREAKVRVVADVPLSPDDRVVADELAAVHDAGAEVVWAWVEGLDVIQLIKQSNAQRYPMRWVAPFAANVLTDALGEDSLRPAAITGLGLFPPITPEEPAAMPAYANEFRRFEESYRHYRGKPLERKNSDLLFQKWLEDRELAQLLRRCGPDCTRNRLVAPLLDHSFSASEPNCSFDFALGRAAGYRASSYEVRPGDAGPVWTETDHCVDRF